MSGSSASNYQLVNFTKLGEILRCNQTETIFVSCIECLDKFESLNDLQNHYDAQHNCDTDSDDINQTKQADSDYTEQSDDIEIVEINKDIKLEITQSHAIDAPSSEENFDVEIITKAETIELNCDCCPGETYACIGLLKDHLFITQNLEAYPCDKCGGLFFNKTELTDHQHVHEIVIEPLECPYCTTLFGKDNDLKSHLRTTLDDTSVESDTEMDMSCSNEETIEEKRRLICSMCDKSYIRQTAYIDHILEHDTTDADTFECQLCSLNCKTFIKLQKHFYAKHKGNQSTETDDDTELAKFHCKICDKTYRTKENFIQHRRSHTGERPYECRICKKRFNHSSYINIHMRTHTKQKPYVCGECGKKFISRSKLTAHEKNHQNIRPHECDECNKSFRTPADLRDHFRSEHTTERPYQCTVCGRSFAKYKLLMQHNYLHAETKRFKCRFCPMAFSQSAGRHGHEKRMHSV